MNGWIILDKPLGRTSTHVGNWIKRQLKCDKLGHAGTLDPLASGVLPLALGEATKTLPYCVIKDKEYIFDITFGSQTSTDDLEGEIIATSGVRPTIHDIEKILPQFIGHIRQVPPQYSAIKFDGKRACDLAREGVIVTMRERFVDIYHIDLLHHTDNVARLKVHCGIGTYVRSIARDISQALGTVGHVSYLRRTRVGKFIEDMSITVDIFEKMLHNNHDFLLPVGYVLDDIPALSVSGALEKDLRLGRFCTTTHVDIETITILCDGALVCMAGIEDGLIRPKRVFNL
jgi:tRNA pseudouridine55 synthase